MQRRGDATTLLLSTGSQQSTELSAGRVSRLSVAGAVAGRVGDRNKVMNAPLIALSFALALISSGCSSQASKKEPAHSEALIIARAAGFKEIRDITAESLKSVTDSNG